MNFFKVNSFIRFLGHHKIYTVIEIFGLSVSLMFVILIVTYARQELSTDSFHPNAERIYMLGNERMNMSAYGIGERVKEHYPEIEDYCYVTDCILLGAGHMAVNKNDELYNSAVSFVSENFFRFFAFPLNVGSKEHVLANYHDAVISQSFAKRAFPGEDPIGKSFKIDSVSYTVNGVMNDIANSVIKENDILVRIETLRQFRPDMDGHTFNNAINTNLFVLERQGSSLAEKAESMRDYFKELYWIYERGTLEEVQFVPITQAYYSHHDGYMYNKGDKKLVMILLAVGILILIFAVINYINLTTAQTGFRAKEMATRSLLGSSRLDLFSCLIMESTMLTFISFGIGLTLAFTFLPYANQVLDTKINLPGIFTPQNIMIMIVVIVVIGFISGLLPAILISKTKAVDVVKGSFRQKTKMLFSKFFITFQNAITIALLAAALVMITQVDYLIKAPLGYKTTNIIDINVDDLRSNEKARLLANEIRQLGSVKRVSLCEGTPFSGGNNYTIEFEDRSIGFQLLTVDSAFVDMMGIEIIRENNVASDEAFYLSEFALKEENLPIDATTFKFYEEGMAVAGVFKDFRLHNILFEPKPILMRIRKSDQVYPWNVLIEVQGDALTAYEEVKSVYERLTRLEFSGKFIDRQVAESFTVQKRTSQIVIIFSTIAIVLSLLGLLAMSTYFIQQRSREIGVRKVFGSSNRQILTRLVSTFLNYVFIAFVIATPITWYLMREWLSGYSHRIHLNASFFIFAGFGCLLISFVTVFWQSYMAANSNPVNSIKTE